MSSTLHLIDAFTDRPFAGNPAGVVLLDAARSDGWMQRLAMEMNQAETAFLLPEDEGWSLRWFTPRAEVDLCGHATLASAHALWTHHGATAARLRFQTRSGELLAERDGDGAITIDLPALDSEPVAPPPDHEVALGLVPRESWRGPYDLMFLLDDPEAVAALDPDLGALARWDARGVIVTAAGGPDGVDFVSRFFAPALGVPEDPVTGSAHCALAPWWQARLGRGTLRAAQLSPRGGRITCRVRDDRVELTGHACTTLEAVVLA